MALLKIDVCNAIIKKLLLSEASMSSGMHDHEIMIDIWINFNWKCLKDIFLIGLLVAKR